MIKISPLGRNHQEDAYKLVQLTLTEHYEPTLIASIVSMWPSRSYVALSAGKVVGYIGGSVTSDGWSRVLLFAVDKNLRGLGIGTLLLDTFMRKAAVDGDKGISLEIRMGNTKTMAFYSDRGFAVAGRIPAFYTNGDDALLLKRPFN